MRIFVAGATGVIGRSLVPLLLRAGHEVVGASRTENGVAALRSLGAGAVQLDVFDWTATRSALLAARPNAVMHQLTDLSAFDLEANARMRVVGTRNLVDAASAAGVRRLVAQSISFAYAPGVGPATEEIPLDVDAGPPRQRTIEGVQTLERAVSEMPAGVILRYGTLYGAGTWYGPGGAQTEKIRAGRLSASAGVASFLHVQDAASAALAALAWPSGRFNIVDDEPVPGTAWLPFLAALLGGPPPPPGTAQPWERGASNAKARSLGWQPRYPVWREGFRAVFL